MVEVLDPLVTSEEVHKSVLCAVAKNEITKPGLPEGVWKGSEMDVEYVLNKGVLPAYEDWNLNRFKAAALGLMVGGMSSIFMMQLGPSEKNVVAMSGGLVLALMGVVYNVANKTRLFRRADVENEIIAVRDKFVTDRSN